MFVEIVPAHATAVATTTAVARPARTVRPSVTRRLPRAVAPYLYLAPALILLAVWTYRPLVATADLSFHSWNLLPTSPRIPVGLDNYRRFLELPEAGGAVVLTFVVILGLLPFTIVLPVIITLLTNRVRGRARVVYQAMVFAPMLVAPVASAAVWKWLLTPRSGAVNRVLGTDVNWMYEAVPAQIMIIVITGWHILGFAVLVVGAGVAGINPDYAAAAGIDGASRWQITRWITLPLLSPTLVFLTLMTVLLAAQWTFPLIDTLTQGGPDDATTTIYYLLWDYGFSSYDAGLATAAGVLFFVGFGLLATVLVWLSDRLTFHDD